MNGTRFVALLVLVAVAAAVWIRLGVPGLPQSDATSPASDTLGGALEPRAAGRPAEAGSPQDDPGITELIDTSQVWSADTVGAWAYRTTVVADLDGDGVPERLILTSDVYVTGDGEPMWEDGHRWGVYVEEDDGKRTLVYGAFVPLGVVDAGVEVADSAHGRRIVILERGPTRARLLVAAYDGPEQVRRVEGTGADIQTWAGADR